MISGPVIPTYAIPKGIVSPAYEPGSRRLAASCVRLFLFFQFLSLSRDFFGGLPMNWLPRLANAGAVASLPLLLLGIIYYERSAGRRYGFLIVQGRRWVSSVLVVSTFIFVYGLVRGNSPILGVLDWEPYLIAIGFAVLGSIPAFWEDVDTAIVWFFLVSVVINLLGITGIPELLSRSASDVRVAGSLQAYRTQAGLAMWPYLLLTAGLRKRSTAVLIFAGVWFVVLQEILFQKRAPLIHVSVYLFVFAVVLPVLARRWFPVNQYLRLARVVPVFFMVAAVVAAGTLSVAGWVVRGQLAGLAHRFTAIGPPGTRTPLENASENERFVEALYFLKTLRNEDYVAGKGFGGYFVPHPDLPSYAPRITRLDTRTGDDVQSQLHLGFFMPLLKGGLLLMLVYYYGIVAAIRSWRHNRREPRRMAAYAIVLVTTLFLFIEGGFMVASSFLSIMIGACVGLCLSRDSAK